MKPCSNFSAHTIMNFTNVPKSLMMQSNGHACMNRCGSNPYCTFHRNMTCLNGNYDGKCQNLLSDFILKIDRENW